MGSPNECGGGDGGTARLWRAGRPWRRASPRAFGRIARNMTLEDFNAKRQAYRRSRFVPALVFFGLFAAAGIATVITAKRIDKFGLDHISIAVLGVSYPAIGLLMYFVLAWIPRRRLLQLGLTCPTCGSRLNGLNPKVITLGRCRFCGTQVLESK